jgi:CheY-like chemotaxis protein
LSVYILVVDDEPDVEALFRQQFRRDLKSGRFTMEFAPSAPDALTRAAETKDPSSLSMMSRTSRLSSCRSSASRFAMAQ